MRPTMIKSLRTAAAGATALLVAGSMTLFGAGPAMAADTTLYVNAGTGSSGASCEDTDPCDTISEAIDKAGDGDTVEVEAGTYAEQVVIEKAITVTGAGAGESIVTADGAVDDAGAKGLLQINGEGVSGDITFEGFTVQDAGPANIKTDKQAIYSRVSAPADGTATIKDNEFLLGTNFGSEMEGPVGILAHAGGAIVVENNAFQGFWQAILAENSGHLSVLNNTFTDLQGVEPPRDYAAQGVYILRHEPGTSPTVISGNQFKDFAGKAVAIKAGYDGKDCGPGCNIVAKVSNNHFELTSSGSDEWDSAAVSASALDSVNELDLDASGNTGHVAGSTTPIEFGDGEGQINITNSAGVPNEIVPTDDDGESHVSVGLDLPAEATAGDPPVEFTGTGSNASDDTIEKVRYAFTIEAPEGLNSDDVTLQYEDSPGSDTFSPISLIEASGALSGFFGPASGFPFQSGDQETTFTIAFAEGAPTGTYSATVSIIQLDDDGETVNVLASDDTPTIEVLPVAEEPDDENGEGENGEEEEPEPGGETDPGDGSDTDGDGSGTGGTDTTGPTDEELADTGADLAPGLLALLATATGLVLLAASRLRWSRVTR